MIGKNRRLINPLTGTDVFGKIPEIIFRKTDFFQEGLIYLKHGDHYGANRGFGAVHIWAEHENVLRDLGYTTIDDVPNFVSKIIQEHAPIHCEFNNMKGNHRIAVLKSSIGVAYLEHRTDGDNNIFYSVVTAFTKGKAHGPQIGTVCK